jgi:hypothetical protein
MRSRKATPGYAAASQAALLLALIATQPALAQEEAESFAQHIYVNVLLGANWPVGSMNVFLDPGFLAGGRAEYELKPLVRVGVQLSFHSFDAERPGTDDNEGVIIMSFVGRALGEWGPYRPFALFGLGAYVSKERETSARRWDGGVQVGTGLEYPISEHFSANTGLGIHMVLRGSNEDDYFWVEGYLGFLFKWP